MQVLSPADRLYSGNSASRSDSLPRETGSFMSALANMTEAEVFFLSPDFVILLANDAAATALGVSRSHLIGHRIDEVLPEFYSHIEMISTELERTGAVFVDQDMQEMRQGRPVSCDTYMIPRRDILEDLPLGWLVARVDATRRAGLRHAVEALPVPIAALRVPELTIELASSHFAALVAPWKSLPAFGLDQVKQAIGMLASAVVRSGEYIKSSTSWPSDAGSRCRIDWTIYCCPVQCHGRAGHDAETVVIFAQQAKARASTLQGLDTVRRLGLAITDGTDIPSFLHTAMSACASFLSAAYCAVIQHDRVGGRFVRLAESSPLGLIPESAPEECCGSLAEMMLSEESSWRIVPLGGNAELGACEQAGIETCVAFPIAVSGRCYGHLIAALTYDSTDLNANDLRLAELTALYCGIALEQERAVGDYAQLEAAQRNAESEAIQNVTLLGALIDSLEDGVVIVDADKCVILANRSAATFFGMPRNEMRSLDQILAHTRLTQMNGTPLPTVDRPAHRLLQGLHVLKGDYMMTARDGSSRVLAFNGGALRNPDGSIAFSITVAHDRTELVQAEKASRDYLRFVSHDLRSPLTLISARAQMLERSAEHPDGVRRNAQAILRSVRQMNSMISDLTDSVRLEFGGALSVRPRTVDLVALLNELIERWKDTPEGDRIESCLPVSMPPVRADADGVERILTNLMSNALKYSPDEEKITVSAAANDMEATISVADCGPGIHPEDAGRLFERFFRSENARKHHDGLGLGLPISKALAEAQGGRIWVETELGRGSVFSFTLPVSPPDSTSAEV